MNTGVVTFQPEEKKITVPKGTDILSAGIAAGVYINSSCGGEGVCGRCRVIVKNGRVVSEPTGRLTREEIEKGYVLACRATVIEDAEIEIPPASRLEKEQILTEESKAERLFGVFSKAVDIEKGKETKERAIFSHSPLATKIFLKLPSPTLKDNISDLERLYRALREHSKIPILQTGLANVRKMGRLFRESRWEVTVLLGKRNGTTEIVLIEPGDTSHRNFGIALDIGTTTIVAELSDLNTHKILGIKATHNRQSGYGEDVITRMVYASKEDGLEKLHHAVVDAVNELIFALAVENEISLNEITGVSMAGNTTMLHLLLRVDPAYLRREPYVPTANFMPVIRAAEAGIKINPRGLLACLPGVSTYVGGDITVGILASGIDEARKLTMLIDIGTNGEIVLGNKEWLVCCSSSAGPAFEGSGVCSGVRAMEGAIQRVEIDPDNYDVKCSVIGGVKPVGICGSGYVDTLAELFKAKLIERSGKIIEGAKTNRVRTGTEGLEFVLSWAKENKSQEDIVITQTDITNIVRSKGAIYTAAEILASKMNVKMKDINKIYLAGGFGNYLNIEKSIWIGMLPDLPRKKFEFIGNSSLTGARFALLSYDAMAKVQEIARKMTYIELSVDPDFMHAYTASIFLPHTDASRFPTVMKKLSL
ncbi:MAG: CDP-6-deoxy-L-threo-D-glycero-4-hexulose-3-dehydrase reductase [Syntrophomonadaceae bacterium]|nr:CDP-6-deoxy-L-threo-D-glycero-4-hexulose-3-dehydrase reductase [Bacillota bacterium]MBT9147040.1 CDP-6-deoxy-L-threo-D-glycero-4-hexulose-3-dehydrase reductase [Bacillota bacterium]